MDSLVESGRRLGLGRPPNGLLQILMRRGVIQLHGFDTPQVIVVASELRVAGRGRECGLGDELVSLVVEAVVDIVAKESVD